MRRGINPHRALVSVIAGDLFVDVEQVAVLLAHILFPEPPNRIAEIEINAAPSRSYASAFIANFLRCSGSNISRSQIAKARITAFEIVITLALGNLVWRTIIALRLWHPDAAVIAQRLRHQRQLRLMLAALGNARGVNLCEARIRKQCSPPVRPPD